ncbi:hypothetical protein PENSPDRAFT_156503 [Peniophora sp. CONT]|nr:hypothetical protein PENSPDRAFT_156503 [Peniophora sp. CONT]
MSIAHSEWTANQLAYQQALQEGPTAALERLRAAFQDRASAPLSKREEVVELADILGFCLRESEENTELWRAMAEINIISLLVDVMAEPDFLAHYLRFASSVCGLTINYLEPSLSAVRQGRRKVTLSDTLWSKIDRAWASLWANRQHLANNSDLKLKLALLDQLEHLASTIRAFEAAVPLNPRSSQDLARVAYFAWVQLYSKERMTERDVLSLRSGHQAQVILWQYLDNCPDDQTRRATMTRIIEDVGVDRSFRATENALKWSLWMVVPQFFTCVKLFTLHTTLFLSSALSANHAGLSAVAEAMEQQGRRIEYAKTQGRVSTADEWLSMRIVAAGAVFEYIEYAQTAAYDYCRTNYPTMQSHRHRNSEHG